VRIIAGKLKGRRLQAFRGRQVRPTADRVREALFNILNREFIDANILDLFAGTGALGIEALSRGAKTAVFVDNNSHSLEVLRSNLDGCALQHCARTIRWDISRNLNCLEGYPRTFNLVFLDPPYRCGLVSTTLQHLEKSGCLAPEAILAAEHEVGMQPQIPSAHFACSDNRRYGRTALSFFNFLGQ
jgi:16S rRNA (guanine966-N2)-methyltransferase